MAVNAPEKQDQERYHHYHQPRAVDKFCGDEYREHDGRCDGTDKVYHQRSLPMISLSDLITYKARGARLFDREMHIGQRVVAFDLALMDRVVMQLTAAHL